MKEPKSPCQFNAKLKGQLCQCADCEHADDDHCHACTAECDQIYTVTACPMYGYPNALRQKGGEA